MTRRLILAMLMGMLMTQTAFAEAGNPCNPCADENPCAEEEAPANPCAPADEPEAPAGPVYDAAQPLNAQYSQMRLAFMSSLPEDMQEFFADQKARLSAKDIPGMAIQEGEQAPELMMAQPGEDTIAFSEFVAQGPVILQFYRGNW